jgi:UDPglucose--hexose-1-phosphate uridylyltransferase
MSPRSELRKVADQPRRGSVLLRRRLEHKDGRQVLVYGCLSDSTELSSSRSFDRRTGEIHRRRDVLTNEWVVISPERNVRPNDPEQAERTDVACPICPGGLELPFAYDAAVFENRFPALAGEPPEPPAADGATAPALGRCEVVVYTPRHEASFAELTPPELGRLLAIWVDRSRSLWADGRHQYVFSFENRGVEAGATLSHPHGQIYAFDHLPPITRAKVAAHRREREQRRACLGCVVTRSADGVRAVTENESFAVAVPFAPRWPYEVTVRARRHGLNRLADLDHEERVHLLQALRDVALRLDALLGDGAPYLMAVQEAPRDEPDWHLTFDFFPLRRGRTSTKIRASVETATGLYLNDVLPETAARRLAEIDLPPQAEIGPEHLFHVEAAQESAGGVVRT